MTIARFICSIAKEFKPGKTEDIFSHEVYILADNARVLFEHGGVENGKEVAVHFSKTLNCLRFIKDTGVVKREELETLRTYFIQPLENMLNESDISLIANRKLVDYYEFKFKESISNLTRSNMIPSRCIQLEFTPRIKREEVLSIREQLKQTKLIVS